MMQTPIDVKLVKQKKRYILTYQGKEITYNIPSFNKQMCWKLKSSAESFRSDNIFMIDGKKIPNIDIKVEELFNVSELF